MCGILLTLWSLYNDVVSDSECVSEVLLFVMKALRPEGRVGFVTRLRIVPLDNYAWVDEYCRNQNMFWSILEGCLQLALCASLVAAGVYGYIAAQAKRSYYADRLIGLTKYAVLLFELALVLSVLLELRRFTGIKELSRAASTDTGHTFLVFAAISVLPQLGFWAGYVYTIYQYLRYTRSKNRTFTGVEIGIAVIYQYSMPGMSTTDLARVLFEPVRKDSDGADPGDIEMVDLDKMN